MLKCTSWIVPITGLLLAWLPAHSQTRSSTPTIKDVVARVQNNLNTLKTSLPDIFCSEQIDSQQLRDGKLKHASDETKVTSTFSMQRARHENKTDSFVETRKILTINGKPAEKKASLPFNFVGGFINGLIGTFAADPVCNQFKLAGQQPLNGSPALLIEITPNETAGNTNPKCAEQLSAWRRQDTSWTTRVWVDPQSMQVIRYEWRAVDVKFTWHGMPIPSIFIPKQNVVTQTTDYSKVEVGGKPFWLPTAVNATTVFPGKPLGFLYNAEYSAYHRYGATTKILPGATMQP